MCTRGFGKRNRYTRKAPVSTQRIQQMPKQKSALYSLPTDNILVHGQVVETKESVYKIMLESAKTSTIQVKVGAYIALKM